MLSIATNLPAGHAHIVTTWRSGFGGHLFAWTAPLAFCTGLCCLAVSSVYEVAVPRWFILAYGAACALLALIEVSPKLGRTKHTWQN
jgi:hypothetical protein